jgi:hypothetical protein
MLLYPFTIDVIFYQVKILIFYIVQTIKCWSNLRYTAKRLEIHNFYYYVIQNIIYSSWHIRTLPHWVPSPFGRVRVCPYSHKI